MKYQMEQVKKPIRKVLSATGFEVRRIRHRNPAWFPVELEKHEREIIQYVLEKKLTMVSLERAVATALAVKHVIQNDIEGDFVECGVWRGGNAIIAAELFRHYNSKKLVWMFDTFTGMTKPTLEDVDMYGSIAANKYRTLPRSDSNSQFWCISSLDEVKIAFQTLDLLNSNIRFVQGDVLQTLEQNSNIPEIISVLRLDTDWYESTLKELNILYPRLSHNGCLIIDDYGHWRGSRKAVDEYFDRIGKRPFLHPIDNTGRIAIKF